MNRRLTAIVFTDIVGYSAIVHRDEALGARLLDRQREVVRRLVPAQGGREVETAGDSFLLEFSSALAAVQAVIAIQQELARSNAAESEASRVVLRASVHLGDVEHRGREVYGDGVNIAAWLLQHSPEGGLALSGPVLAQVRQRMKLPVRSIGTPELKNISSPVDPLLRIDYRFTLAEGFLQLGDTSRALDEMLAAVAVPSIANGYDLRWNPAFRSPRGNPRFEKLIADNLTGT